MKIIEPEATPAPGPAARRIRRGVIGVLHDRGRYLVIQRAAGVALGGTWCFPGGHIEPGENARRAVVRELREELGVVVRPFHRLGAVAGRPDVVLAIWLVEHLSGAWNLNRSEIADFAWLSAVEIREHPLGLPSNLPVVDRLETWRAAGESEGRDSTSSSAGFTEGRYGP